MLLDDYCKVGAAKLITLPIIGILKDRAYQPNLYSDSRCFYSRLGINISKSGEESISSQSSIFSLGITSDRGS